MKGRALRRGPVLWGLVALLVAGGAGVAAWPSLGGRLAQTFGFGTGYDPSRGLLESLDVYGEVPDFALTERSGRRITRADLLGKVWISNFIYTQCTETCPIQSAQVARLQAEFVAEEDLRLVSITVDPERDTPEVLSRYADRYGADPKRWLFLTGDKRAIYRLAKEGFRLGVVDPDEQANAGSGFRWLGPGPAWATHGSKGLIIHSSRFVLVDRQARIRAYHLPNDEQSLKRLRRNVTTLMREKSKEK